MTQPISILLCALGGEGGGVLADWLVDVARHAGHPAQATSIPGVAQRTGATTYYLEVYPLPHSQLQGRLPVLGLNPLPGRLDALVSSELLETARQIGNGLASNDRTLVISASSRALTTAEKMTMGDGRRPEGPIRLLTNLRCFGYVINPVSYFFCYDEAGRQVQWVLAEVHNTPWGERHCYVLPQAANRGTPERPGLVLALISGGSCAGWGGRLSSGYHETDFTFDLECGGVGVLWRLWRATAQAADARCADCDAAGPDGCLAAAGGGEYRSDARHHDRGAARGRCGRPCGWCARTGQSHRGAGQPGRAGVLVENAPCHCAGQGKGGDRKRGECGGGPSARIGRGAVVTRGLSGAWACLDGFA